jgi:hypothetical protein
MGVYLGSSVRAVEIAGLLLLASGWIAPRAARAVALPVEVEFTIQPTLGIFVTPGLTVSGAGTAIVNGSGAGGGALSSLALPAGVVVATGVVMPITDPLVAPVQGVQLTVANGAGTVGATGGGQIGGPLPASGVFRFCLFGPCGAAVANLIVPLSPVGVGGMATVQGPVNISVFGAPWTTGTAMLGALGYTITGFVHGPSSNTSTAAQPGGTLQLVTPIAITTNIGVDNQAFAFGILTVRFVPEAATAMLLGAGIVMLGALGRRSR